MEAGEAVGRRQGRGGAGSGLRWGAREDGWVLVEGARVIWLGHSSRIESVAFRCPLRPPCSLGCRPGQGQGREQWVMGEGGKGQDEWEVGHVGGEGGDGWVLAEGGCRGEELGEGRGLWAPCQDGLWKGRVEGCVCGAKRVWRGQGRGEGRGEGGGRWVGENVGR